ncbi:MAG: T9SS type A sorting domain-containing protein [Flavobacteriales bacterium]|nr:T9SS type A sorting domain-containing protein [Flavobacteriales bacterium]
MKRTIHLLTLLLISGLVYSQSLIPIPNANERPAEDSRHISEQSSQHIQEKVVDVDVISISSVSNIFTILNVAQNQVHYVPELEALSFVHRQDIGEFPEGGSGTVRYDISMDQGANWTLDIGPITPQMVSTNAMVPISTPAGEDVIRGCRYPNGLIYNPPGNTDMNNAFYVSVGPALFTEFGDAVGWGSNYFSSTKLDGSDPVDTYQVFLGDDIAGGVDGLITTLVQGGEAVHAMSSGGANNDKQLIWRGVLDEEETEFEWSVTEIEPEWKTSIAGAGANMYNGYQNMAFSADGSIGYAVFGGALEGQEDSLFIPNVYTTADQGVTWELASDNFEAGLTTVGQLLDGRPYLRNFDCVVDSDGNLRIFAEVLQLNTDYWTFFYAGYLVEYVFDGTSWEERLIGEVTNNSPGVFQGNFQDLFMHPQASISADGDVVIYTWSTTIGEDVNINPDIFGRAINTESGYITEIKNLTEESDAESFAYYNTSSPVLITGGSEYEYEVPTVCFLDWSGDNLDPVQLYYLKGMGFDTDEFLVGIEEEESPLEGLLVYPNPANEVARVSFAIEQGMKTQIRVLDAIGRIVITNDEQNSSPGIHNFEIETSVLDAGNYIIEIIADATKTTRSLNVVH